ncbi:MAG: hypothetical protein ACK41E_01765 [Deinococcales bacterium]
MTEVVGGSPNQWDIFVYWVYGASILLLGGYAWYLIRMNLRLKAQAKELEQEDQR